MAITSFTFDEQYYLQQNPDVAAAVSKGAFASGQAHFNAFGRFEQRDPNAYFDTSFYLGQYPDVAASGLNPFQHFLQFGSKEFRAFNANELAAIDTDNNGQLNEFNVQAYLDANPDVKAAVNSGALPSAYQHFVIFGQFEGRTATLNNGTVISGPITLAGNGTGGANPGTTFTLTAGADTFTTNSATPAFQTTANDDVFRAPTSGSLSTADFINAGNGTDRLTFTENAALTAGIVTIAPSLTSVEQVFANVDGTALGGAGGVTFSGANSTGLQQVWSQNSVAGGANATTFTATGISKAVTVGIEGGSNSTAGNAARVANTFVFNDVTGTTDTASLALKGAQSGVVTIAGVETLNIAATGTTANSLGGLTAANATTVNVSGAAAVALGALDLAATVTIDASTATGAVSLTGEAASTLTFKGGAGADTVNFLAGDFTVADTLTGGAGKDTVGLVIADAVALTTTIGARATGFEALAVTDLATTGVITASNIAGVNEVNFTAGIATGNVETVTGLTSGATIGVTDVLAVNNGSVIAQITGADVNASDVLNINLTSTNATAGVADAAVVTAFTATGIETLNISSVQALATEADSNAITTLNGSATTVNVSGNALLTIGTFAGNTASVVNAAASTGGFVMGAGFSVQNTGATITGGAGADTLRGGIGNDTIIGGAGVDLLIGGNGVDTLTGGAGADLVRLSSGANLVGANRDIITDFSAGGVVGTNDVIQITATDTTGGAAAGNAATFVNATTAVTTVGAGAAYGLGASTATNDVIEIGNVALGGNGNLAAGTDGTELLKALASSGTASGIALTANSNSVFVAAYQNNNAYVYHITDAGADGLATAGDIQLVGVLQNVAAGALATNDFAVI